MYEIALEDQEIVSFEDNGIKKYIVRILVLQSGVKIEYYFENLGNKEYAFLCVTDLPNDVKEIIKEKFCEFFV